MEDTYRYEETIIKQTQDFPELEIIEMALNNFEEYYYKKRIEYIQKREDKKFNYKEKMDELNKSEKNAKKLVEEIKKAMQEYKNATNKLSSYDSKRIKEKLDLIGDKKIIKTYSSELEKINAQKMKAKQQLIKALSDKNLKFVPTTLKVTENKPENEYLVEKNIGEKMGVHQSLGKIIDSVGPNITDSPKTIANQFVTKTEINAIEGKQVNQKIDYSNYNYDQDQVTISTPGKSIYVSDAIMKKEIEFNNLTDEQKIQKMQEYVTDSQPLIGKIDIILKSQTDISLKQKNMLQITKDAYKQLSQIDIEFERIKTTIELLENKQSNEILPKTKALLEKYYARLIEQRKEQLEKIKELAKKTNLETLVKREERSEKLEQIATAIKVYETKISMTTSIEEKNELQKLLKEKEKEYEEELNNTQIQEQSQGRSR